MTMVSPDHPRTRLLFFARDFDDASKERVEKAIEDLASSRSWLIEPPAIVDCFFYTDEHDREVLESVTGGALELYCTINRPVDRKIDLQMLDEVEMIVSVIQKVSAEAGLNFEFELYEENIGEISRGELDRGLSDVLIGEWRRSLGLSAVEANHGK